MKTLFALVMVLACSSVDAQPPRRNIQPHLKTDRLAAAPVPGTRTRVVIQLEGDPLVIFHHRNEPALLAGRRPFRMEEAGVPAHRQTLAASRREILRHLAGMGFQAEGEVDVVLHAVTGTIPSENIPLAASLPGVVGVHPEQRYHRTLDGALPLINAVAGWTTLGGESKAGAGMRIGVIDTGVDINNPMMQDSSLTVPAGFPKGDPLFTNNKVIVARNYLSLLGVPEDTPSALDHDGHGTFVASIAGGRRVKAPRAEIVGIAPGAFIGNYRVFSSPLFGSSTNDAAIIAALNDAVSDGMNAVNISIGGGFPVELPSLLPIGQAIANATKAGVIVTASAGNDGPAAGTVELPSDVPEAISVGASSNQRILANPLRVTGPGTVPPALTRIAAVPSDAPPITAALSLPVWAVRGSSCASLAASEAVQNAIALFKNSFSCFESTMVTNAARAGAKAVVIYLTDADDPYQITGVSTATIPVFQLSQADGTALATFAATTGAAPIVQATIDPQISSLPLQPDRIAIFSSIGPDDVTLELKPDLVAPGSTIYSGTSVNDYFGILYDPAQFTVSDGTSFSAPMVSGAATLLRQLHPTWTTAQIKSGLVNTAANVVRLGGQQAPLVYSGNGRLDVGAAFKSAAAFDPVSITFGSRLLTAPGSMQRPVTVTNLASTPESFTLTVVPRGELTGSTVTLPTSTTTIGPLAPQQSASVPLAFSSNSVPAGGGFVDGRIQIVGGTSGITYSVPYWGRVVDNTVPSRLSRYARGRGQIQPVSTLLAQKIGVQVLDGDYIGVAGVPVSFSVSAGGGSINASSVVSDFNGFASVSFTLGPTPGLQQLMASAAGDSKVISSTATPSPIFTSAGLLSAATFTSAVAPGSIASLFGTGLAAGTGSSRGVPLPTLLNGAQVLVNGTPAPLFFSGPGQINFQIPFELEGQTSANFRVTILGITTPAVTLPISAAAPGLFTTTSDGKGTVVAQHGADSSPVTAQRPAVAGETIVLYGTGLGPVDIPVASGAASPANPPAKTKTAAVVKIGGVTANVSFSGLVPGAVGLYQVNAVVPAGVPSGSATLVLSVGSANSNSVTLPVQ